MIYKYCLIGVVLWLSLGDNKKPQLGHLWSIHGYKHTMAQATLIGHRDVQSAVGAILSPHCLIGAYYPCHDFSYDFGGSAKYSP